MKSLLPLVFLSTLLFAGCEKKSAAPDAVGSRKVTIAMLPKSKGNQYFVTCEKGARSAAEGLGVELLFDGPTNTDPAKQNEIVENWITLGVDAIAAACENKEGISTALQKARQKASKSSPMTPMRMQMREAFL